MSITSFYYFLMITAGAAVYYIVPKKVQWTVLLAVSLVFYRFAGTPYTFAFIAFSAVVIYVVSLGIAKVGSASKKRALLIAGIVLCVIPWLLTAARGLWDRFLPEAGVFRLTAALGMGYYTSMAISYMTDCYREIIPPQKNPLKLLLYLCFFPQLITGPISRYEVMTPLYKGHAVKYKNVTFGAQRILWGLCKKLILAERLAVISNGIWGQLDVYGGPWLWFELLVYPCYMYSDFSGCMDIVIGTAEIFGISLPENFNNPFFSQTVGEFWRRWHITLGQWAKDYVMYPVLKSDGLVSLGKKLKKRLGKNASKFLTAAIASGMVWLVMGVWHGAFKYIIGVSLYFWVMLELGELVSPYAKKLSARLNIRTEAFGWRFLRAARTYFVYSLGAVFFAASGTREAMRFIKGLFLAFSGSGPNMKAFSVAEILNLGVSWADTGIIFFMVFLIIIVGCLRERHGYARNWIADRSIALRWLLWIVLFFGLLIWGRYGEGYDAAAFIYQVF